MNGRSGDTFYWALKSYPDFACAFSTKRYDTTQTKQTLHLRQYKSFCMCSQLGYCWNSCKKSWKFWGNILLCGLWWQIYFFSIPGTYVPTSVDIRITAYYHKQHTSHMLDWMPLFRTMPDISFGTWWKWHLSAFLHSIFCDNHLMPKSYANKQRLECWHLGLKLESFVYLLLKDGSNWTSNSNFKHT